MDNEALARFHSSAESLAGEIPFRNTCRKSGFSEREIDAMILKTNLRKKLFKDWNAIAVSITCVTLFVLRPVFRIRVGALLMTLAAVIVATWVLVWYRSRTLAEMPEQWVRTKGQTWTGVWERN